MSSAIVGAIILLLCLAVVIAVAKDNGPGPDDVAVSYELRVGPARLRSALDPLGQRSCATASTGKQFVAAKRAAYAERAELRGLAAHVDRRRPGRAAATTRSSATRVELRDGAVVHNRIELVRRSFRWQVVAYALTPSTGGRVTPRSD